MNSTSTSTVGTTRFHDLDALRAFAMLLGILLHALLSFVELPVWPAQDLRQNSAVYGLIQHAIHGFRMPLFFLISGFFTAMLWRKRGLGGLLRQRAVRILVPLAVGWVVVWPVMIVVGTWGDASKKELVAGRSGAHGESIQVIWSAAKRGDAVGIEKLLKEGANPNGKDPTTGVLPLEWAALGGHPEAMAILIEGGAKVDGRDREGSTALHAAAFLGRSKEVALLLENGASVIVKNRQGEAPLDTQKHDWRTVQWLAAALEIEVNRKEVMQGRKKAAELLLAAGAEPAVPVQDGGVRSQLRSIVGLWIFGAMMPFFHHLWFLYYLCLLVGIFVLVVLVKKWLGWRIPNRLVSTPMRWLWIFPLTFLAQLFMLQSFGPDTASGILPWPPKLFYYAVFFGFGALCFGKPFFEKEAGKFWVVWFLLAIPIFVTGLYCFEHRGERFILFHPLASLLAVCYVWLMIFGCIGFFRRFFNAENPTIRYVSDSAYWLYLAHLPLVIAVQILVAGWPLPSLVKLCLVCGASTGILLVIYEWGVRYTFVGAVLNGRKRRDSSPNPSGTN